MAKNFPACTVRKTIFSFFQTSWKDGLYKKIALEFDLSCFIGKDYIYYFSRKWKMIFLKKKKKKIIFQKKKKKKKKEKNTGIWYLIQMFWKDDLFKKDWSSKLSFLYYQERWYFFPENMVFSPWTENEGERTYLKKYIETWYFLLDIFHTVPEKKKIKDDPILQKYT